MPEPFSVDSASILVPGNFASELISALQDAGLAVETAGSARGVADDVALLIVATPSLAALALAFEKVRLLHKPRTYLRLRDDELEIRLVPETNDGQTFVIRDDGSVEPVADPGLSMEDLIALLRRQRPDA